MKIEGPEDSGGGGLLGISQALTTSGGTRLADIVSTDLPLLTTAVNNLTSEVHTDLAYAGVPISSMLSAMLIDANNSTTSLATIATALSNIASTGGAGDPNLKSTDGKTFADLFESFGFGLSSNTDIDPGTNRSYLHDVAANVGWVQYNMSGL